jgi:hypothetical protein
MSQSNQLPKSLEHNGFEAWIALESTGQKQAVYAVNKPQVDKTTVGCWIEGTPNEVSAFPDPEQSRHPRRVGRGSFVQQA